MTMDSKALRHASDQPETRRWDYFFWAAAGLMLFWALGARALWAAEGRWAEVAREMLLSGDFFHPTIAGLPYFDKPLFSYWLIALTAPLTGLNEWAVRLPSACCALAALWATRRLGAQLWSPAAGRLAGWLLLTAQGFLFWARAGAADMANVAFIMLAIAWYWQRRARPCFSTYLVFYLLLFIGAQMKGLTAVIVPILAIVPDLLREKRWRRLLAGAHWLALALGLLVYILPFLYSAMSRTDYASSGIALVLRENVRRFFDPFDHIEPFYIYLKHVPVLFLPWSPLLIVGLAMAARREVRKSYTWPDWWLALALGLIFLFFTASGSRRSYYILPILPFCAIFCANWLLTTTPVFQRRLMQIQSALLALLTAGAVATAIAMPLFFRYSGRPWPAGMGWVLAAAGMGLILAWLPLPAPKEFWQRWTGLPGRLMAAVATIAICMAVYFCAIQPLLERYRTEKSFALEIRATGRNAAQTAFFSGYLENVVFYMGMTPPSHPVIDDPAAVYAFLQGGPERIVILRRKHLPRLLAGFPPERQGAAALAEKTFPWQTGRKAEKKMVAWQL